MAETTQEKKVFKWGDNEYLLDDLLSLHAQQEQSYYDFAKNRGKYSDDALAGLRAAITSRIDAAKNGRTFMADGSLDDDVVDNVFIPDAKKRKARKGLGVNQDNTEWSKYYIAKLVSSLKPYQREAVKDASAWDIAQHGFGKYLSDALKVNARHVFENYDKRNESDPEAARTFTERDAKLREHLGSYKTWLEGKNFDFTKNDNEWDDDFMTTLNNLINNQDWSDRTALYESLSRLGTSAEYATAFTSDKWDLSGSSTGTKTNAELEAERKRKKAEEETSKYQQYIKDTYSTFKNLGDNNFGGTYFTSSGDGFFDMSDSEYESWLNTHTDDADAYMKNLQAKYYANPFDTAVAGEYLPLAGRFGALKDVTIDGKVYKYDPKTIDRTKNRFVAFDPESGEIRHAFIGDIAAEKEALKRKWRIDNGYLDEAEAYMKEGGVISMQTGGGFNLAQAVNRDLEERNKARAVASGNTEEVQRARDRVVSNGKDPLTSEENSIGQPDAGFTGAEIARLASIGADITSIFLDPITGTAVGLASTLTNFGADIADDGFDWGDVKNLGINIGFDLLGAVPIIGDYFGTGSKIIRTAAKWAPRAMATLAGLQGVANLDGMMGSWKKLTSGDADSKMTVQDWRNIQQSISLLTGGVRATRNKVAKNKMKKAAKVDDVVGVNIKDKSTGEIKQILVDGDTAKNIRAAQGDRAKIETELGGLEQFKGKFGESGTLEVATHGGGLQKPWEKVTNADGSTSRQLRGLRGEGRAQVSDVYDFSRIPAEGVGRGLRIPGVSDRLNQWHQAAVAKFNGTPPQINARGAMTSAAVDAEVQKLQGKVDAEINTMKQSMSARTKKAKEISKQLAPERTRLNDLRTKLGTIPDAATLQTTKTQQEASLAALDTQIAARKQMLQQAEADLAKLQGKKRVAKKNRKAHNAALASARGRVQGHKAVLQGYEHTKSTGIVALDQVNQQLQMHADLPGLEARVRKLEGIERGLSRSNHTNAYTRLQNMLTDYQTNHANIGGRSLNWDMATILQNAGIRNAFREGGTINRNKINKFLNYAKG